MSRVAKLGREVAETKGCCKLMDGRKLAERPINKIIHICDWDTIVSDGDRILVFVITGHDDVFYFGTSRMLKIYDSIMEDKEAREEFESDGLSLKIEKEIKISKGRSTFPITTKGRSTFPITIYDEDDIAKKSFKYSDFEDILRIF